MEDEKYTEQVAAVREAVKIALGKMNVEDLNTKEFFGMKQPKKVDNP